MTQTRIVSVAIITFQHAKLIERCMKSVMSQNIHQECEVVIRDDGSTDGTTDVINEFIKTNGLNWTFIDEKQNRFGEVEPLARVLSKCHGDYIAFLEGDDFWEGSEKLERQREFLDYCDHASMVGHLVRNHDPENLSPGMDRTIQGVPGWRSQGHIADCHLGSMMIRRPVADRYLEVARPEIAGDILLGVSAATCGASFVFPFVWGNRWKIPTGVTSGDRVLDLQIKSTRLALEAGLGANSVLREQIRGHLIRLLWAKLLRDGLNWSSLRFLGNQLFGLSVAKTTTLCRFLFYPITRFSETLQPTLHGGRFFADRQQFRTGISSASPSPEKGNK